MAGRLAPVIHSTTPGLPDTPKKPINWGKVVAVALIALGALAITTGALAFTITPFTLIGAKAAIAFLAVGSIFAASGCIYLPYSIKKFNKNNPSESDVKEVELDNPAENTVTGPFSTTSTSIDTEIAKTTKPSPVRSTSPSSHSVPFSAPLPPPSAPFSSSSLISAATTGSLISSESAASPATETSRSVPMPTFVPAPATTTEAADNPFKVLKGIVSEDKVPYLSPGFIRNWNIGNGKTINFVNRYLRVINVNLSEISKDNAELFFNFLRKLSGPKFYDYWTDKDKCQFFWCGFFIKFHGAVLSEDLFNELSNIDNKQIVGYDFRILDAAEHRKALFAKRDNIIICTYTSDEFTSLTNRDISPKQPYMTTRTKYFNSRNEEFFSPENDDSIKEPLSAPPDHVLKDALDSEVMTSPSAKKQEETKIKADEHPYELEPLSEEERKAFHAKIKKGTKGIKKAEREYTRRYLNRIISHILKVISFDLNCISKDVREAELLAGYFANGYKSYLQNTETVFNKELEKDEEITYHGMHLRLDNMSFINTPFVLSVIQALFSQIAVDGNSNLVIEINNSNDILGLKKSVDIFYFHKRYTEAGLNCYLEYNSSGEAEKVIISKHPLKTYSIR